MTTGTKTVTLLGQDFEIPEDMQAFDISMERRRTYLYADGSKLTLPDVAILFISARRTHRILHEDMVTVTYPRADWLAIQWEARDNTRPIQF